jgi:glyoxylase-like metal-dependent hydrolase (beta-lactamase superfamily II)
MLQESQHGPVTRFRLGREVMGQVLYWTSCYYVDGLLVDTGCAHTAPELLEALAMRPVELIVNTHYHEDHVGGNALIAAERGAPVLAPEAALPALAEPPWIHQHRELVWGRPQPSPGGALGGEVRAGGRSYQVLPAAGHTADQVMLHQPEEGWLFCGDAYISDRPKTARPEEDYGACLATLRRMAALEPAVLFSCPAGPVEPAAPALERAIAYLEEMGGRIRELAAAGMSPEEIVQEIWGRESSLVEMTEGQFSYRNFVEAWLKG